MAEEELYKYSTNKTLYQQVCVSLPPGMNTNGAGGSFHKQFDYSLPLLEFQMVLIFCFNLFFHFVFRRLGFSKLITHITAGISIGVILKKLHQGSKTQVVFSLQSQQTLSTLTQFGYMLFLFIIGVKMDMKMIITTGKKAFAVGVIALIAPLMAGFIFAAFLIKIHAHMKKDEEMMKDIYNLAVTQSLTTFPVISYLLSELEIINSELGRLALSSGVISEFLSIFLLTISTTVVVLSDPNKRFLGTGVPVLNVVLLVIFIICAVFVIRPAMFWVIQRTPEGRPVKDSYIMMIIGGVILSAMVSHGFGQFVLFAPYILGLAMPDGPPLGSALVEKLETFVSGMLMPLFVTSCASRVMFFDINDLRNPQVFGIILVAMIAFAAKFIACLITTKWGFKMPWNDGLTLSLIMSAKGIVEIATYSFLRDSENITEKTFTIAVFVTMVQACIIPIIVKRQYDPSRKYAGYQKRNITHLRTNDELRLLVCIHRPDNIGSVIKLLDASSATNETPIGVFVLHLIELVGRTTPIFISHQYQKKTIADHSYSENVIIAFEQYENRKKEGAAEAVSVQMFTAISPPKLMHEDIGTLALNKLTSLIIMPFHRKWAMDGSVESDNHNLRALNCSVLDMAPCSVGILIHRGRLLRFNTTSSLGSSCSIAMIFIGGNDDREALAYAKRMARGSTNISLTVIRFMDKNGEGSKEWDWVMDSEVLKEVKLNQMDGLRGRVGYREEMVVDGPEMALRIRAMGVDDFDLVLVGRRQNLECPQTSGLMEWSEFPELGVVGDLLASPDLESRTSILVVQQQRMAVK